MHSYSLLGLALLLVAVTADSSSSKREVSIGAHGQLSEEKLQVVPSAAASVVRKEQAAATIVTVSAKANHQGDGDDDDNQDDADKGDDSNDGNDEGNDDGDDGEGDDEADGDLLETDSKSVKEEGAVKSSGDDDTDSADDSSDDTPIDDNNDDAGDDDSEGDSLEQDEEVDRSAWGRRRRSRRRRAKKRRAPKPVNCKWGPWKEGKCDKTCGIGEKTSIRSKKVVEKRGGTCYGKDEKTEVCNAGDCLPPPTPAPTPAPTMPVQAFASRKSSFSLLCIVASYIAVRAAVF